MSLPLSILLVEDNQLNQRIVTFSLQKYNYQVSIANNGQEAVDLVMNTVFDVVLMDIMMPVMDGLEATRLIREFEANNQNRKRTPIIAITANTLDNDRDRCISLGMDDFMAKPFDVDKLHSIFRNIKIMD